MDVYEIQLASALSMKSIELAMLSVNGFQLKGVKYLACSGVANTAIPDPTMVEG
ncbi:hypothetical protein PAXRUDRAFT_22059 [Paxillus rubicundulus Ve08.2h10]|uniref:Uncharacterized protein n=1 Tax=Paxillus rubicundulus Ve08.2h10 TaxID=930991 RepID=A0A0D0D690_9AGAM|nr:hypothetical protein PAXRUDRAFT_22059 [Paxillus rubicundulus Ve08.2h10]